MTVPRVAVLPETSGTAPCRRPHGGRRNIQILRPVNRQPSSTRLAVVRSDARSEPLSGSLRPSAKVSSPAAMRGSISALCASVPNRTMLGATCRSAIQCAATGAPARSSSTITVNRSSMLRPRPPYCGGIAIPTNPAVARRRVNAGSQPESQASQRGTNPWVCRSRLKNARICSRARSAASTAAGSGGASQPIKGGLIGWRTSSSSAARHTPAPPWGSPDQSDDIESRYHGSGSCQHC